MASLGQIIFYSMVTLIVIFAAIIILILALAFSGSSSTAQSSDRSPVANLGEDELLSCFLDKDNDEARFKQVSVTWQKAELTGLVYQYKNGAEDLANQNAQYRGRTQLFPDALDKGNASLLLRRVRRSDEGVYTCTISSSDSSGKVSINVRTAAFSAPTFSISNGILTAEANRWLPKPNVTWSDNDGTILQGSTSFTQNAAGIFSIASMLQPVNASGIYTCSIQNDLVMAVSEATITASGVSENTYFIYSAASSLPAASHLSIIISILKFFYLV